MISERQFYNIISKNKSLSMYDISPSNYSIYSKIYSGVLVIVHFTDSIPSIILTKRSSLLRNHSGEISFPGGKFCSQDKSIVETAIRETYEEIGFKVNKEQIVGCLTPTNTYTTNILIYPFIALLEQIRCEFHPNFEVEQVINLPIERLMSSITIDEKHSTKDSKMFKFVVGDHFIWGATARIIKDLLDVINRN